MTVLSVIVSYTDLHRTSVRPSKNYSPLVIDSDAMKTLEVSLESFEPVSRWGGKITQRFSIIQDVELPGSDFLDTSPPNTFAKSALFEEPFNGCISEALYRHASLYHDKVYLIKVVVNQAVQERQDAATFNRLPEITACDVKRCRCEGGPLASVRTIRSSGQHPSSGSGRARILS
jgi:hypothetical protein